MFGMRTGGSSTLSSPQWLYNRPTFTSAAYILPFGPLKTDNYIEYVYSLSFQYLKAFVNFFYAFLHISTLISLSFLRISPRPISIGQLNASRRLHLRPINLIVFQGSYNLAVGISYLEASFTLRCFQRLSRPHFATLLCRWRDNRRTSGAFIPVLSY